VPSPEMHRQSLPFKFFGNLGSYKESCFYAGNVEAHKKDYLKSEKTLKYNRYKPKITF
jgi:hypothetical protein